MQLKRFFINMLCPSCKGTDFSVSDSRPNRKNNNIRRRRMCNNCGEKFSTLESIVITPKQKSELKPIPPKGKRLLAKLREFVNAV